MGAGALLYSGECLEFPKPVSPRHCSFYAKPAESRLQAGGPPYPLPGGLWSWPALSGLGFVS